MAGFTTQSAVKATEDWSFWRKNLTKI